MAKRRLALAAGLALAGIGGVAWSCADTGCSPDWTVAGRDYACAGRIALTPGNNSRINLLLLIRSLRPVAETAAAYPKPDWDNREFGHTFFTWQGLRQSYWPHDDQAQSADIATPACAASSRAEFSAALAAEPRLPPDDRATLEKLRAQVGCTPADWSSSPKSAVGREYAAYLHAAQAFYASDWPAARSGYATLANAKSTWVRETAAYMPIRIGLRAAVAGALDQYGDFEAAKVDHAAVADARAAITAYLHDWPKGRYAASARGLIRRVQWLEGDRAGLARSYEALAGVTPGDSEAAADLVEEIDTRLLVDDAAVAEAARQRDTPLMLAAADLRLMRPKDAKGPGVSAADLAAQKPAFAAHESLYGLLEATRALYAGEDPHAVMALIPDATHQSVANPLAFTRQVLRGMALDRAGDRNAPGFWRDLLTGATGLYQRPLVETALAQHWTNTGRLAAVFAPGSPVTNSAVREVLLRSVAPPTILRATAVDTARPAHERDLARFTLLARDLTRDFTADFVRDLGLVEADPPSQGNIGWMAGSDAVPLALFVKGRWSDGFPCPAIAQTAAVLARNPTDPRARLCLGDFMRLNGLDQFDDGVHPDAGDALGAGKDQFPGKPAGRAAIYADLIADRRTPPDLRAYALYRAVMCYAPSGYSKCLGTAPVGGQPQQAPKAQRKAWFDELHKSYPQSPWAQSLRYWW